MTHSLLRPDRRPAGEGHTASADPSAGLYLPRPAESCGFDGKPGIPSDDAESAKMENGTSRNPGRAPEGVSHSLKSSQAVTHLQHWSDCAVHNEPAYPAGPCDCGGFHSVLPDPPSRDGTDSPVQSSSPGSGTLSDPQASSSQLAATSALSGSAVPPLSIDPAFFEAWRETQGQSVDAEPRA